MESRIHLTGPDQEQPAPAHCSACFAAKPTQPHVDFSAHYDGPVVPALEGTVGVVGHMIDELVLCEECITTAAGLIGLGDVAALGEKFDRRGDELTALHERLEAQQQLIDRLEAAESTRESLRALTRSASTRRQRVPS